MNDADVTALVRRRSHGVSLSIAEATSPAGAAPFVFVHGGCHGAWQFEESQREFARLGRSSIALDWLNHGESDDLSDDHWFRRGIESVVYEIGVAVDASPEPPVLFGHSMGGMAVTQFACQNPGRVRGLVLAAPVIPKKYAGPPLEMPIDQDEPWGPPPFEIAREFFFDSVSDERAAEIYPQLRSESPRACQQATQWTLQADIHALDIPVMVLTGGADALTPSEPTIRMAEAIGAHHVSVEGSGHGVVFDPEWRSYCEQIDAWVASSLGE